MVTIQQDLWIAIRGESFTVLVVLHTRGKTLVLCPKCLLSRSKLMTVIGSHTDLIL